MSLYSLDVEDISPPCINATTLNISSTIDLSLLDIDIFTEETMKCITFYLTDFVNDQSSKVSYSYEFYKTLYYKDGVLTDEFSFINQDGNSICSTDTLEGDKGGCTLSSEVKQNILKRYEKDSDYQNLKRYLDRISY